MRKSLIVIALTAIFTGIAAFFWYSEFVYSLPTPVPKNYNKVATGTKIALPASMGKGNTKPVFLHFFNPDCPCSKFNINHFKSLVKEYAGQANFAIVTVSSKNYTAREIQQRFKLDIPVFFDTAIAASCGVYSTPQAVIIDTNHELYYRGNYNRSRYCTDKKTNYAQQALAGLLNNSNTIFNQFALKAYGCTLPNCSK